jgi:S1-C subfamily serine protease
MTGLDWVIVGIVILLALFGWAQGFVAGALALAGFALGAWLGTRIGPLLLPEGSESPYAPAFGLAGALFAGAIFAGSLHGLGWRLRGKLTGSGVATLDGAAGALLTACVGLGLAWIVGAVALHGSIGDLRREVQRSSILQALNSVLPPSGSLLNALARFDPSPRIDGPGVTVRPPRAAIARDRDVQEASRSVVKVLGTACGLGVEGSGWVVRPGLVVTNAHVVAGQDDTRVYPMGQGSGLEASAVAFDTRNDLAILRVDGLDSPSLSLAGDPDSGASAAILGFPHNGPYDVRAGRLGPTREVISQDAYGRGPVRRRIVSLRGLVRSGNSGGPMVDGRGRVVATIFAATTSGARGGYGVPNSVVREELGGVAGPVSTGECVR